MILNFFVLGSGVVLGLATSVNTELDTIAFKLATVRDRVYRGGVLVQKVDLFEGQSLGLEQNVSSSLITRDGKK